jgi:hypothetical protein
MAINQSIDGHQHSGYWLCLTPSHLTNAYIALRKVNEDSLKLGKPGFSISNSDGA